MLQEILQAALRAFAVSKGQACSRRADLHGLSRVFEVLI